jgi:polyisoprenoid-binding protein YceI
MKKIITTLFILVAGNSLFAQERVFTKAGNIIFYSKTPMENIEAANKSAVSVLDKTTGNIEFSLLMKAFEFEKALMQEHFNENYVESDKFPKANFKGRITDISKVDFKKDGNYTVTIAGDLTLHGATKTVTVAGNIVISNGIVSASSSFDVQPEDFKISIPSLVKDKIAKSVKIIVNLKYQNS